MKKSLIAALFFLLSVVTIYGETSFAVLPVEAGSGVSQSDQSSFENSLNEHLIQSKKYKIIDRNHLEKIMQEQKLYLSGVVDQTKVVELGKIAGVDKILIPKIYLKKKDYAVSISVIDVQTAQIELNSEVYEENSSASDLGRFVVARILNNFPLLGEVLGKTGDNVIVNLGSNHGLKTGTRLFVTRKEVLKDDAGNILYVDLKRVGTLTVTSMDYALAKTKVRKLTPGYTSVEKGDIISIDVYPKTEPVISYTPLLPDVKKGKLILNDDMSKKKYLSPTFNSGPGYTKGKLFLDSTKNTYGHCYASYPAPYNDLTNFIIEVDMQFQQVSDKYNKFSVDFRANGSYITLNCYSFYIHDEGGYALYNFRLGGVFDTIPLQSTPALNRGESQNRLKVVAVDDTFDLYINDIFVGAFKDEAFESGSIMFKVNYGGYSAIDNVKIWEAVK